jgi:hypothetical protein
VEGITWNFSELLFRFCRLRGYCNESMPSIIDLDMTHWTPNKSLQATGAAPSVLDGTGDGLLPSFVAASFPAPVPELKR